MIEAAPFPVRPDSVRPADLLGPYDGIVLDADSERPIGGATVAASWAFERGIGLRAPAGAQEYVTETSADGRFVIPKLDELPGGASMRVRRFTLIVYHRGHVAWRSDRLFPGREARRDFSQRGSRVRLERWQSGMRHAEHVAFLGGGTRVRTVAAWELQAAALELEGQAAPVLPARETEPTAPAIATTAVPLDISKLLSDDEIRGVTGYVGKFEDGKLTDLPTTEFYDSRHFKATGKPESYDVGVRLWRLGTAAAEVQYRKLQSTLPEAKTSDEVGDASFRAKSAGIAALVYLVRERGVVVWMTCGGSQCTEPGMLTKLAKLVESRLPELPAEGARPAAVPPPAPEETP
ncbi:MAG TPA: carboxypeptidase-like regulatory domain-containing protein [Polyangia bacterium]|nr:carboxypeptidase-like regulatory domain-containing protein [Polyangia bacterium]